MEIFCQKSGLDGVKNEGNEVKKRKATKFQGKQIKMNDNEVDVGVN